MSASASVRDRGAEGVVLKLLGPFAVRCGCERLEIRPAGQRVLTLLALLGGSAHRSRIAGTLWPNQTESRALSNLRAAVWRLPPDAHHLVHRQGHSMHLATEVQIDVAAAGQLCRRLLDPDVDVRHLGFIDRELLTLDLLPSEDDDWLVVPREQHRQRRLHALEALAAADLADGRALDAVDTALLAVAAEPLRESAQALVIRAHLAAGNRATALEHFEHFRRLLSDELGVVPSPELTSLVAGAVNAR